MGDRKTDMKMTDPVDTEALRALAAQHEEAQLFEDDVPDTVRDATGAALRAATDEVDRLRAEADVVYRSAYRLGRQHSGADMYKQQANELRALIENAPHAADCRAQYHGGDRYGNGGDARYCICWKADAS